MLNLIDSDKEILKHKIIGHNFKYFVERLMKENLWTQEYTIRVINEYQKFIYLSTIQSVAPSFPIDQVWHTHILFSEDYTKMCDIIGTYIHHKPNIETNAVSISTKDDYIETLKLYREIFKEDPPLDIWTKFNKNSKYIYIDLNQHWIIPAGDWKALIKLFFKYIKTKLYV
jgi:hypothetical protein